MANKLTAPSTAQVDIMYRLAVTLVGRVHYITKNTWKDKSWPIVLITIAMLGGLGGTLYYFITTSRITPLLLFVACMLPILLFALLQTHKTLQATSKEFAEYNQAIGKFLSVLLSSDNMNVDEITTGIAASICAATTVCDDSIELVTFGDLRKLSQFHDAVIVAQHLTGINAAIRQLQDQGIDVETIVNTLNLDDYDVEDFLNDNMNLLEGFKNIGLGDHTCNSCDDGISDDSLWGSSGIIGDSGNSHIINTGNEVEEDLTIVV